MMRYKDRVALAWAIRERLPWASVVAGAPHCAFIDVLRGETIIGQSKPEDPSKTSWRGSVWSRPPIGSRYLRWEAKRGYVEICEHVYCPPGYADAWKVVKTYKAPRSSGKGWIEEAAKALSSLARRMLRALPLEKIAAQLKASESFEIQIHPLKEMEKEKSA